MQGLQSLVLLQKLDDCVVARLSPVQDYSDLHDEFERVSFSSLLRQNKVYVVFLAHAIDDIQQVLLLDLSRLLIFLLAERFRRWLFFGHLVWSSIDIVKSRRRLDRVFLRGLHCLERVEKLIECPILFFLVAHFDSLRRRLDHLLQGLHLSVVLAITGCQSLQGLHVRRILHDGRPVCIAARWVHLLVITCRGVFVGDAIVQQVRVRC